MPYDLAQGLQALGVAAELGMEVQRQIGEGAGNINRLLEAASVPLDAKLLADGITSGTISADLLAEGSFVPEVAVLIAKSVNTPRNTALPTITGTAQVGVELLGTGGSWTGPYLIFTLYWTADGVAIPGATNASYTPVVGDVGKVIRFVTVATNASGSTSATSAPTAAVIPA